ncbi:sensor histidine kinase [Nonomuraea sp. NPDC050556]|uniref:sensor histidine kinase n=1 Tax=Nonomuraea sp. NPDC050556 TaxID=3364369 RepID=UPI0037B15EF7
MRRADPLLLDGALAVAFAVGTWLWVAIEGGHATRSLDAAGALLILAVCLPLTFRRRYPCSVLVASCVAAIVFHQLGYHTGQNNIVPLVALYSVAAHRRFPLALVCWAVQAVEWSHATLLAAPGVALWVVLAQEAVVGSLVIAFGATTRRLATLTARLRDDHEDLARLAVAQERARIARELHDIVAHHMSVISVQAGVARYVMGSDPATAQAALATISDVGAEALAEMRRLLSILRLDNDDRPVDDLHSAPGLRDLPALADRVRSAGVEVEVVVTGEPRPMPPGMDLSVYRILQECLTNILKHAGPTTARVSLTYAQATLVIQVTDDGKPRKAPKNSDGHGLLGLTERVKLYQGTISAGPRPMGGYEVVAVLPLPTIRTGTRFDDQGAPGGRPDAHPRRPRGADPSDARPRPGG